MDRLRRLRASFFWRWYLTSNGGNMNWNPDDPILKSPNAPHESRATMRMHRAGWPGPEIAKALKLKGTQLMRSLQHALDEEGIAGRQRRPIHDAKVPKGTV